MLERILKIAMLYDLYGAMLTDKQQRCLELHYLNDFSLAEIAAEFQVSRQAVHDILRRGEQILADYEAKLGLAAKQTQERATVEAACRLLEGLPAECRRRREVEQALNLLKSLSAQ